MPDPENIQIWRVYNNMSYKNETHVLWPHTADRQKCAGYNGDVNAWSEHNKVHRFGCAQIMQVGNERPTILYEGYLDTERLEAFITEKLL